MQQNICKNDGRRRRFRKRQRKAAIAFFVSVKKIKCNHFPLAARLIVEEKNHLQEKQREEGQM